MWSRMCWVCSKTANVYIAKYCRLHGTSLRAWVAYRYTLQGWGKAYGLEECWSIGYVLFQKYRPPTENIFSFPELFETLTFYSILVSLVTHKVWDSKIRHGDHIEFVLFVWISEQTAHFPLYIINRLVFITEVERVYSAVRTESLYKADTFGFYKRGGKCLQRGTDWVLI
jgi:hypothetical protein